MIQRIADIPDIPRACAASVWPMGTESKTRADDLRDIGALVHDQPDDRRLDGGFHQDAAEVDVLEAEHVRRGEAGVDDHELHEERGAADQPDVQARDDAQRRERRASHHGDHESDDERPGHREHRDEDGQRETLQERRARGEQVLPEEAPVEIHRQFSPV
nr:hypothetical protein [Microbacterium trichothecenolyticum]